MCKYCEPNKDNSFVILNETSEYSGIEFALHSKGMLRCRYYGGSDNFQSQDVVNIEFCPMCSKKFNDNQSVRNIKTAPILRQIDQIIFTKR